MSVCHWSSYHRSKCCTFKILEGFQYAMRSRLICDIIARMVKKNIVQWGRNGILYITSLEPKDHYLCTGFEPERYASTVQNSSFSSLPIKRAWVWIQCAALLSFSKTVYPHCCSLPMSISGYPGRMQTVLLLDLACVLLKWRQPGQNALQGVENVHFMCRLTVNPFTGSNNSVKRIEMILFHIRHYINQNYYYLVPFWFPQGAALKPF